MFLAIIFGFFIANLIKPAQELSFGERRRLAQLPKFTLENIMSGKYMNDFDKYTTDQFIGREPFRAAKNLVDRQVFLKLDTNGLFREGEDVFSIEYPLREDRVAGFCKKMNGLFDKYFEGMNVYYSVVPDKNYFLPDNGAHLLMDYRRMETLVAEGLNNNMQYIDVFGTLTLDSYYNTDGHWRQEKLKPVVDRLYEGLGVPLVFDLESYEQKSYEPFYGAYYGQSAGLAPPDNIVWLENESTRNAVVTSLSFPNRDDLVVYNTDGLGGMDTYDLYLYGAQPLVIVENPQSDSDRELILVRDSYGSSLAPLLLEGYAKVTLVDLRYITQELLQNHITFENQDVLLMFSTTIINNSDNLR